MMLRPLLVLGGCLACAVVHADWSVNGSTGVRWDSYRVEGDAARSPFPQSGSRVLGDLQLDVSGRDAAHGEWQFQFEGLWNASDRLGDEVVGTAERMRLSYRSDPSRFSGGFDLGDQYVELSPLTFAREIRGLRAEWLPSSAVDGRQHAVTAFGGIPGGEWHDADPDRRIYGGAWAVADNALGRLSAQVVHQEAGDNDPSGDEWVGSVLAEREFTFAHQQLRAQGEWAHYRDELHQDEAVLARVNGRDADVGLDYEVSYQHRGEHFAPSGLPLSRDFRGMAARAGLQVAPELVLHGNVYRHTYAASSDDPLDVHGVGLNVRGPLHSEVDVQSNERNGGSGKVDSRALSVNAKVDLPLFAAGPTQLSSRWSHFEDRRLHGTPERASRELGIAQRWRRNNGSIDWDFSAGLTYRKGSGAADRTRLSPTFGAAASTRNHRLAATVGMHRSRGQSSEIPDLDAYSLNVDYRLTAGRHAFGLEYEQHLYEPEDAEDTDAQRIGAYWRYDFTA